SPRAVAAPATIQYDARGDAYQLARPMYASERPVGIDLTDPSSPYAVRTASGYPVNTVRRVPASAGYDPYVAPAPRRVVTSSAPRSTARVEQKPKRDWTKTAMIIGG